ncbi:hypothetical protein N2599_07090 [Rhizobium sullae]|uniref:RDD family protein n=1 Tax=Rhizobium sullae TaxID=50338 RepID=A0ABY5XMC6_RHISU|nr:hypothetical protein [Rhizobium sullae]UWU15754.1 hypothetical protein N2599_07090 [Rhizobium sullae]
MADNENRKDPATWRIVSAALLDFFTAFFVVGYIVGWLTGSNTPEGGGFQLSGWAALVAFALIVAYFIVFDRFLNGTIWKRILSAKR